MAKKSQNTGTPNTQALGMPDQSEYDSLLEKYQAAEVEISALKKTISASGQGVTYEDHEALQAKLTAAEDTNSLLSDNLEAEVRRADIAEKAIADADSVAKVSGNGFIGSLPVDDLCGVFPESPDTKMIIHGLRIEGNNGKKSTLLTGTIDGTPITPIHLEGTIVSKIGGKNVLVAAT